MLFCQCRRTDVIVLYAPGYTNITRKRNFLAITARLSVSREPAAPPTSPSQPPTHPLPVILSHHHSTNHHTDEKQPVLQRNKALQTCTAAPH